MRSFYDKEGECTLLFSELGDCYHLWTPEDFEILFTCDEDFQVGMGIIAIAAKLFPEVRIITFEIMSNHLHITAVGIQERILLLFDAIKRMIAKYLRVMGRKTNLKNFTASVRLIDNLNDMRNVIVYDNRNGYVVSNEYTPYTYPWGANRFFFNPDTKTQALEKSRTMTFRERRQISRSHIADNIQDILMYDGYALPLSFCSISIGERLFRDPIHYFNKVTKSIESNKIIAREIGESLYYTDDELFSVICRLSKDKYNSASPTELPIEAKLEVAKTMRYDYNASVKQIIRMLKIKISALESLGIK